MVDEMTAFPPRLSRIGTPRRIPRSSETTEGASFQENDDAIHLHESSIPHRFRHKESPAFPHASAAGVNARLSRWMHSHHWRYGASYRWNAGSRTHSGGDETHAPIIGCALRHQASVLEVDARGHGVSLVPLAGRLCGVRHRPFRSRTSSAIHYESG